MSIDARLGATCQDNGACHFEVWAPFVQCVDLLLVDAPERRLRMQRHDDGYFTVQAADVPPGSHYLYALFDDNGRSRRRPDPASRHQPDGVHGPSRVVADDDSWEDDGWCGLSLNQYVIYELHVGTFTPEGTFDGVIGHLDHLVDLGVTAVELMPVAQFPGGRNWGYDGVYPFAVQDSYGGPDGLKRLVAACHRKGLAVVLDVVYNHLGPEGNYLRDFGPYFTNFYRTPWGEAVNFDGPHSDPVRRFFIENALQWVDTFRIDALRLDAVHAIMDFTARPFLEVLGRAVHSKAEALNRQIHLIAESALNDTRIVRPRELGGFALDAQWNDDFHHSLHTALTDEREGYYGDYNGIADLGRSFRDGYVYQGRYSPFRQRTHGNSSRNVPARQLVVFAQNHDQVGNRMRGERLSTLVSFEAQKLAAGLVLLSPFIPLIFMGEEYGETAPFLYFVSHSDSDLVKAVRRGRKAEFADFAWQEEPPDPQDPATFGQSKLDRGLLKAERHRTLLDYHRALLRLRVSQPALANLSKRSLRVTADPDQRLLVVDRRFGCEMICLIFRFHGDAEPVRLHLPDGRWRSRLDSAQPRWLGPGSAIPDSFESNGPAPFMAAPNSVVVLVRDPSSCGRNARK